MSELKKNMHVKMWVDEMAALCKPDQVHWCTGSEYERLILTAQGLATGELEELDQFEWPGCVYHRTALNDVARTENLTFICCKQKEDAGPNNNWMLPEEGYRKASEIFRGSMKGRTMYVVPYIMGHPSSPFAKIGIELTDSIYVVLNMRIMTRMGDVAANELGLSPDYTRCLHGQADLELNHRLILHFPEDNTVWSVGSGYGGNVLLGKKCLALRIASWLARNEGWMAEHMLILGVTNPAGEKRYVAAAFPSACGKTNLAMLIPPDGYVANGWKVECVGDDIAWMRIGEDGRLWAVNPEFGFFGVAPGTNAKTNPNALDTVRKNTIFTNVLKYKNEHDRWMVWWEDGEQIDLKGKECVDWTGRRWTPGCGREGANKNSRFTAPAIQCPSVSPEFENPDGVPIDAIIFGGRRARTAPLVYESFDWDHGTFMGATMASELTAAQYGAQGKVRRDPMAMLPFTGYHMGDYWQHWLDIGDTLGEKAPKIFHVNWFRSTEKNRFVWPGFGENLRVLEWILKRCAGDVEGQESPIGLMPKKDDLNLDGIVVEDSVLEEFGSPDAMVSYLQRLYRSDWQAEVQDQQALFYGNAAKQLSGHIPERIAKQFEALRERVAKMPTEC